jgi:hypothetical protein
MISDPMPRTTRQRKATRGGRTEPPDLDVPATISTSSGREQFRRLIEHFKALGWIRAPHPNAGHCYQIPSGKGGWRTWRRRR